MANLRESITKGDTNSVKCKIKIGECDVYFENGFTPLLLSIGNIEMMGVLLELGANVNAKSQDGSYFPLYLAAERGDVKSVRFFIDKGADVCLSNSQGFESIHSAVISSADDPDSAIEIINLLIKNGSNINCGVGVSPLMLACVSSIEVVMFLVDKGASVNLCKENGSPLHAAIRGNKPEIVEYLLRHKADANLKTTSKHAYPNITPLELAKKLKFKKIVEILERAQSSSFEESQMNNFGALIKNKDFESVKKLVESGLDVNGYLEDGLLPIIKAVSSPEILKYLISKGANVNGISKDGGHFALGMASDIGALETVKILLDSGADADLTTPTSISALVLAVIAEKFGAETRDIIKLLIDHGANIESGTIKSPLILACSDKLDLVDFLVSKGANVNGIKTFGAPLHSAIESNKPEIVLYLIQHGADLSVKTGEGSRNPGLTPNELAKKLKFKKIVEILERAQSGTKQSPPADMKEIEWDEFSNRLKSEFSKYHKALAKPAKEKDIENFEQLSGLALPPSFKQYLLSNNGQAADTEGMIVVDEMAFCFMSIDDIVSTWSEQKELVDSGEFGDLKAKPDKQIKKDWWNIGWVPFASNGGGDYVCLDFAPTAKGTAGQIIATSHDSPRRTFLALSFSQWLAYILEQIQDEK